MEPDFLKLLPVAMSACRSDGNPEILFNLGFKINFPEKEFSKDFQVLFINFFFRRKNFKSKFIALHGSPTPSEHRKFPYAFISNIQKQDK
jgi:hypothetical protein